MSNSFEMEWPPRSGRVREFPEIDRVAWFDLSEARVRIKAAQAPFLDRLDLRVGEGVGVRNSDQVLDLRLRNTAAQACQHL